MLNKEEFLKAAALPYIDVEAEGMGTVRLQAMSINTRDMFQGVIEEVGDDNAGLLQAAFLVHCISDDKGELLLSMDDVESIGAISCTVIDKLFIEAQRVNGMLEDEDDAKKK